MSKLLVVILIGGVLVAAYLAMHNLGKGSSNTGGNPLAPTVITAQMPNPLAGQ